jgi:hypothetical protein
MSKKNRRGLGSLLLAASFLVLPFTRASTEEIKFNPGYSFVKSAGDYTLRGGIKMENSSVQIETALTKNNFTGKFCTSYDTLHEKYETEISAGYNFSVFKYLGLNVSGKTFIPPHTPITGNIEATLSTKALPINFSLYFQGIKNEVGTGKIVKLSYSFPVEISKESSLSFYGSTNFKDRYYGSKTGFSDAEIGSSFSTKIAEKFNLEFLINHKFPLEKEKFPSEKTWEAKVLGNFRF